MSLGNLCMTNITAASYKGETETHSPECVCGLSFVWCVFVVWPQHKTTALSQTGDSSWKRNTAPASSRKPPPLSPSRPWTLKDHFLFNGMQRTRRFLGRYVSFFVKWAIIIVWDVTYVTLQSTPLPSSPNLAHKFASDTYVFDAHATVLKSFTVA